MQRNEVLECSLPINPTQPSTLKAALLLALSAASSTVATLMFTKLK